MNKTIAFLVVLLFLISCTPQPPAQPALQVDDVVLTPTQPSVPATTNKTDNAVAPEIVKKEPASTPQKTQQFTIEADDYGYYIDGEEIRDIEITKDMRGEITFNVRLRDVYFGGLDFRSANFETQNAKPGRTITIPFTAEKSFTITSYWPSSNRRKADLDVIVKT